MNHNLLQILSQKMADAKDERNKNQKLDESRHEEKTRG